MNLISKIAAGCKAGFSIILGSCLYFSLNWIPVVGPVSTGFIASKMAGVGIKKGFAIGALSGIGGTFLVLIVLFHFNMLNIPLLFIFGVWNVFGILFAGAGGAFASIFAHNRQFSRANDFQKKQKSIKDANNDMYIVCPRCGTSNSTNRRECIECGSPIDSID